MRPGLRNKEFTYHGLTAVDLIQQKKLNFRNFYESNLMEARFDNSLPFYSNNYGTFSRYPSHSSFNITPQDTSPIPPPGTVTTPPDLPPPVTLGMTVSQLHLSSPYRVLFKEHTFYIST